MKVSIQGEEYPLFEAIGGASLGDLKALKARDVTVRSIKEAFNSMLNVLTSGGDPFDLTEDVTYLDNMVGVVFLALRKAGHEISLEDAEKVPALEVFLVLEDEDANPKDEAEAPTTSTT